MSAGPLIHIGYHKTGTTYLQTGLFRPELGFAPLLHPSETRRLIVLPDDYTFDPAEVRAAVAEATTETADHDLATVISDERLSGSPHAGGYDTATIARRLHATFPTARVLIGIREQRSMIRSVYNQYVRDGGTARLDRYLAPRGQAEVPGPRLAHWEYDKAIAQYVGLFGSENVLVVPVERLREDENGSTAMICEFADVDAPGAAVSGNRYPALTAATLALKRQSNRLFVRNNLSPGAPFYVKNHEARFDRLDMPVSKYLRRWSDREAARSSEIIAQMTDGVFRASNATTEDLTGLDLEAIGYDCG